MQFCADLSGVLSKDGETRGEVDLLLSTLGTSEPGAASEETCSDSQIVQPCSSETSCLPSILSSDDQPMIDAESALSCVCEPVVVPSSKSDHAFASVGGNCLVSESSTVCHSDQNSGAERPTSSQPDTDHSILMISALSTLTPLDADESTDTRIVPSSSASIVSMEQQLAIENMLLSHGELVRCDFGFSPRLIASIQRAVSLLSGSQSVGLGRSCSEWLISAGWSPCPTLRRRCR